ncbi:MAG TPA: hypothetical protein DCQ94_21880 [Nitrospira sp.]|jgi:hypothetical protein|nr:hypothetical protein [Nitrospira sp.]
MVARVPDWWRQFTFLAKRPVGQLSGTVIPVDGGISSYTLSTSDEEIFAVAPEFVRSLIRSLI